MVIRDGGFIRISTVSQLSCMIYFLLKDQSPVLTPFQNLFVQPGFLITDLSGRFILMGFFFTTNRFVFFASYKKSCVALTITGRSSLTNYAMYI